MFSIHRVDYLDTNGRCFHTARPRRLGERLTLLIPKEFGGMIPFREARVYKLGHYCCTIYASKSVYKLRGGDRLHLTIPREFRTQIDPGYAERRGILLGPDGLPITSGKGGDA